MLIGLDCESRDAGSSPGCRDSLLLLTTELQLLMQRKASFSLNALGTLKASSLFGILQ